MAKKRSRKKGKKRPTSSAAAAPADAAAPAGPSAKSEPDQPAPTAPARSWLERAPALLLYLAGGIWFWSYGFTIMRGSDLWWHLASGRWMWEHRAVPSSDPWSFTHQGKPWMHHEWLTDVIYHAWSEALGMETLVFWKWGVIIATFLLLMWTLHRLTRSPFAAFAAALFALAVAAPFLDIRPHIYSLLGFAALLRLTLGQPRAPRWLPLLFLVWVNLHGGFFFGLMALAIYLAAAALFPSALLGETAAWPKDEEEPRRRWIILGVLGLVCVAICLANPHGIEPFAYPLRYAFSTTSPYRSLGEWHPPFQPGGIQAPLFRYALGVAGLGLAGVLVSGHWRRNKRETAAALVLSLLTVAMALKSRRFIPLFAMSSSLLVAPMLAWLLRVGADWLRDSVKRPGVVRSVALGAATLALVGGVFVLGRYPLSTRAFLYLTAEDTFPVETIDFIRLNGIGGNTFAYYNWGGYIHLHTDGQIQVYIDGRADTIFDDVTYKRYVTALSGGPASVDVVEGSGADWVLWPKNRSRMPKALFRTKRWRILFEDAVSVLLQRVEATVPPNLSETPDSPYKQLRQAEKAMRSRDPATAEQHAARALEQMPHLGAACYMMAQSQAIQQKLDAAAATVERCNDIFPDAGRVRRFRKLIGKMK